MLNSGPGSVGLILQAGVIESTTDKFSALMENWSARRFVKLTNNLFVLYVNQTYLKYKLIDRKIMEKQKPTTNVIKLSRKTVMVTLSIALLKDTIQIGKDK